ncbi:MAG: HepT-like ribonuclease domain-containing protein [Marinagarivorans sp.]|nr:HepT-like ribonuclease domain-containing protein [Marinagarivorans sp.]
MSSCVERWKVESRKSASVATEPVAVRMKNAVGFRNAAAHCYDDLNLDIVFAICTQRLNDFKTFAKQINDCLV